MNKRLNNPTMPFYLTNTLQLFGCLMCRTRLMYRTISALHFTSRTSPFFLWLNFEMLIT